VKLDPQLFDLSAVILRGRDGHTMAAPAKFQP